MSTAIQKYDRQFELARTKFEAALPEDVSMDRFKQLCLNAISANPTLLECTPASVLQSCMQCAEWGLWPGSGLSEAHLIPFKGVATMIPDWKGLVKLATQHPAVHSVQPQIVCDNDEIDYQLGDSPYIHHKPPWSNRGELIGVYAIAHLEGGVRDIEIMGKEEVDKTRDASPGRNSGAWRDWYGEMARKTVIKRLMKRLPKTARAVEAIDVDNRFDGLRSQESGADFLTPGRHSLRDEEPEGEAEGEDAEIAEEAEYSDIGDDEIPM